MKADITRDTFNPEAHRRTVRFQQGRVPLDADLNEAQDLLIERVEIEAADIIGSAGGPIGNVGFGLSVNVDGKLVLSPGRYYVDGILCTLEEPAVLPSGPELVPEGLPNSPGLYLAVLEVWIEHLTLLEDDSMQEVALNGADTATRQVIRNQVRFLQVGDDGNATAECSDPFEKWDELTAIPSGKLAARAEPEGLPANECSLTPGAGYRNLLNNLYRVEIHRSGNQATATFKWSRENGSILASWLGKSGDELTISEQGRDPELLFQPGGWVELIDRERELRGDPGTLVKLVNVKDNVLVIDPTTATGPVDFASFQTLPRVRRWESAGALSLNHAPNSDGYSPLEYGIEIRFADGTYATGDYWTIPARTATGDVEWPLEEGTETPILLPREGIERHYARLGILGFDGQNWNVLRDCRRRFPPLTRPLSCCQLHIGDGLSSHGDFDSFDEALRHVPASGGVLCFLPGEHRLSGIIQDRVNLVIRGCGERTVLRPVANPLSPAIFTIERGRDICIEDLSLDNENGIGIYAGGQGNWPQSTNISVQRCQIRAGYGALVFDRCRTVRVSSVAIQLLDRQYGGPGIVVRAIDAEIEDCTVEVFRDKNMSPRGGTWGGIHVRAGSAQVVLRGNRIAGGRGHGITLSGNLTAWDALINPRAETPTRETAAITVTSRRSVVRIVDSAGKPQPQVPVSLKGTEDAENLVTDAEGNALFSVFPGRYEITLGSRLQPVSANRTIVRDRLEVFVVTAAPIAIADDDAFQPSMVSTAISDRAVMDDPGPFEESTLRELATVGPDESLPISQIEMSRNRIENCGFSGIGILPTQDIKPAEASRASQPFDANAFNANAYDALLAAIFPSALALFESRLLGLHISDNTIRNVFQNPLPKLSIFSDLSFGGITLGSSSHVHISRNTIEAYGDSNAKPVAGVFVLHADGLDLLDNEIVGKEPSGDVGEDSVQGYRGAIVVRLALDASAGPVAESKNPALPPPERIRVCGNAVHSTHGRALTLLGFGDMRVESNRLQADLTGPAGIDLTAGNSLILNFGGILDYLRLVSAGGDNPATGMATHHYGAVRSGFAGTPMTGNVATDDPSYAASFAATTPSTLPNWSLFGARTHISQNRFILGNRNRAVSGLLAIGFGDMACSDNQFLSMQAQGLPVHVFCMGSTVRSMQNRLTEAHLYPAFSLLTFGMGDNATVYNQGDHCIFAFSSGLGGSGVLDQPNQVLYSSNCPNLGDGTTGHVSNMATASMLAASTARENPPDERDAAFESLRIKVRRLIDRGDERLVDHAVPALNSSLVSLRASSLKSSGAVRSIFGEKGTNLHPVVEETPTAIDAASTLRNAVKARERLRVNEPATAPIGGIAVEGTVLIDGLEAVEESTVALVATATNQPIVETETATGGLFKLNLESDTAATLSKVDPSAVRLVVKDEAGTVVGELRNPFGKIKPDTVYRGSLHVPLAKVLDDEAAGRMGTSGPSRADTPSPTERVILRDTPSKRVIRPAQPTLDDLPGLAPISRRKLREAHVTKLDAIVRMAPARLKRILGPNVDITKLKENAKRIVESSNEPQ